MRGSRTIAVVALRLRKSKQAAISQMSDSEERGALIHLAGAVAHELNNIFTSVAGNLSLLDEHLDQHSISAEMIGEVVRTVQRGIALSSQLQAFAGRQPLKRRRVDINRLLSDIVRDLRKSLQETSTLLFVPAPQTCISFVDVDKLRETICELAANAVTAMRGSGQLSIKTSPAHIVGDNNFDLRSGSYIKIQVSDSGPGMDQETVARALDPMFSTKAPNINVGWGLSKCAGFIRQSGGAMLLDSAPGRGTSIDIYLPAERTAGGIP
jgi:signal transduction histidine kinase